MSISNLLAPIPKWVLINNEGTVAGGAKLYTFRSLNKIQEKAVFQDPGGTIPYTNPIIFDLNGTEGPFYWTVNSANLNDTYYLEAYDADDNLLWTVDNYFPPGAGGGGNTSTFIPLTNYIANNQFIDHIADVANPINLTNLIIAPSNHKGFTPSESPLIGTFGALGSDIRFVKNNTAASDEITFPLFPLASAPLIGDVTPVDFVRYACTNSPVGETYKCFQFPITQKVKNLANQIMTFKIWAAVATTPVTLTVFVRQYFGSGTAATPESAATRVPVGTIVLSNVWTQYNITLTIPDVGGTSIGTPGLQTDDDALYIQLEMPLGSPCEVFFIKPKLYLGAIDPSIEFDNYDQINSINSTPRTGDVKTSLLSVVPRGWVPMNDGSIGNVASGATNRANADTFQLYSTIYTTVADAFAPVSGGRTAPGNTMAAAITDFLAGKRLTLPLSLGRALAGAGAGSGLTARALGQNTGTETNVLTGANLPVGTPFNPNAGTGDFFFNPVGGGHVPGNNAGSAWSFGVATATSIMQPTSFMNIFIKL